jgi:hypothetical protein
MLECLIEKNLAARCGVVSECLKEGMVIVAPVAGEFCIGQTIYLVGGSYCAERKIIGMQLNGAEQEKHFAEVPTELGFQLNGKGRKKAEIYIAVEPHPTIVVGNLVDASKTPIEKPLIVQAVERPT